MKGKAKLRILTLVVGLVTVAAIVVSQLFYFQDTAHAKVKKDHKTEQKENSGEESFISIPSPSLPSSSYVSLQIETFCLFEISLEEEEITENNFNLSKPVNQFFSTLLGALISPNAP